MNNKIIDAKFIEDVEDIVTRIMDDIIDGSDPDDIMGELDELLGLVGSKKSSGELNSY